MQQAQARLVVLLLQLLLVLDTGYCAFNPGVYGAFLLRWKRIEFVFVILWHHVKDTLPAWCVRCAGLIPAAGVGEWRKPFWASGVLIEVA